MTKKEVKIKKSSIKTGIFMSIIPVLFIIFFGFKWQVIIHIATYTIPLFFIRILTFSENRKHVFWIPLYLFIHTSSTYIFLTSKISEYKPDRHEIIGATITLIGALVIFFAPR